MPRPRQRRLVGRDDERGSMRPCTETDLTMAQEEWNEPDSEPGPGSRPCGTSSSRVPLERRDAAREQGQYIDRRRRPESPKEVQEQMLKALVVMIGSLYTAQCITSLLHNLAIYFSYGP